MITMPRDFSPRRILVIQLRQIGDVLLTTPALRALRKRFPEARISFLAEPLPAKVLEGNPNIDEIIIRDPKNGMLEPLRTIQRIRARRFDLVIDFLANPRTALISFISGAGATLSYADNRRSIFYTHPVTPSGVFSAEQKLSLLRVLEVGEESMDLDLRVPERADRRIAEWFSDQGLDRAPRPLVCLEPFQKWPALTYPAESFARLCELMAKEFGAAIVVCWGPGREDDARRLAESSKASPVLAPKTDLHELAALYYRADLWVGVDCGPRHIAASQGLPTFAILGPSDDAWTPPGPRHLSVSRDSLACVPCNRRVCPEGHLDCMKAYPPEQVFARLDEFWKSVKTRAGGRDR